MNGKATECAGEHGNGMERWYGCNVVFFKEKGKKPG